MCGVGAGRGLGDSQAMETKSTSFVGTKWTLYPWLAKIGGRRAEAGRGRGSTRRVI